MKALILAAGRGSRMRHLTRDRPKGLVALHGVPLVARQCAALRAAGATEIGIVTGYMAESFLPFADRTFHNDLWAETQMVASLSAAAAWLETAPLIVSYSDIFYEPSTVEALSRSRADLAITFDPDWQAQWSGRFDDPLDDAETFRLCRGDDGCGYLSEIGRKPGSLEEVEGQYMGLLRFTPAGWRAAQTLRAGMSDAERNALDMTTMLDRLVSGGLPIEAIASTGPWGEIDSVEDLEFFGGETASGS